MYGIIFDLDLEKLDKYYHDINYHLAYDELRLKFKEFEFDYVSNNFYITENKSLTSIYKIIDELSQLNWFKNSVKDIKAFRVESFSDFTQIIKESRKKEMTKEERVIYEEKEKALKDKNSALETARERGIEQGREIVRKDYIKRFLEAGYDIETISKGMEMPVEEIQKYIEKINFKILGEELK